MFLICIASPQKGITKKDISVLLAIVSFSGECWNNGILGFVNHDGSRNILNSL